MRNEEKKFLKNVSWQTLKIWLQEIKDGETIETIFWKRLLKRYPWKREIVEGEVKKEEKKENKSEKKATKKKSTKKSK